MIPREELLLVDDPVAAVGLVVLQVARRRPDAARVGEALLAARAPIERLLAEGRGERLGKILRYILMATSARAEELRP